MKRTRTGYCTLAERIGVVGKQKGVRRAIRSAIARPLYKVVVKLALKTARSLINRFMLPLRGAPTNMQRTTFPRELLRKEFC
jgi:hypothetical protein